LEVIEKYGSDALRTYMMFMGPVEQDKIWNDGALNGVKKFLDRVERLCTMDWREKESVEVESLVHQTIL
jgi:leucyl-tRNA synthetase